MIIKKFKPTIKELFILVILILLFVYFFIGLLIWANGEMVSKRIILTQNNYQDYISVNAFNLFPRRNTGITFSLEYIGNRNEVNNEAREFMWAFRTKPFIDFKIKHANKQEHLKIALSNITGANMYKENLFIEHSFRAGGKMYNFWDPVNVGFVSYEINLEPEILAKLLQYYELKIEADFLCPNETLTAVYLIFSALSFHFFIQVIPLFILLLIIVTIPIFRLTLKIVKRNNNTKHDLVF